MNQSPEIETTPTPADPTQPADGGGPKASWWARLRGGWSWRRFLVEAVIVVAVVWGLQLYQTRKLLSTGEAAPALSLFVLGAEDDAPMPKWSLEATAGKPRLLYFWAPWCGVCNQMTGTISALRRDLEGQAEVVSVACAYKSVAQVRDYVREHGVDYPVLLAEPDTAERFHVNAFPTFYIVSSTGEVTSRTLGFTTSWGLKARMW